MAFLKKRFSILILFLIFLKQSEQLDNGLLNKPPMGWIQWARYVCITDCIQYPNDCVSEKLFIDQATVLAKEYLQYGYEYINIDDCWSEMKRDSITKKLIPDKLRFPSGIKKISDYVHSLGLKMGIYGDIGTKTCQNYPGFQDENDKSKFFFDIDSKTFAEWEIDFLKVDGCYGNVTTYDKIYPELGKYLNKTGRPIAYSCSWPAYLIDDKNLDFKKIAKACNIWRNYDDIEFSWQSVTSIIDYFALHQDDYVEIHGPNQWYDPDMIIIGNNGLSLKQMEAQMAIWSIWSAPLFMSNDLRTISLDEKKILTNKHVIDIDQDDEGILGLRVYSEHGFEIWLKPITPIELEDIEHWQYAIVYFNRRTLGSPSIFTRSLKDILLNFKLKNLRFNINSEIKKLYHKEIEYQVLDLFDDARQIGKVNLDSNLTLKVDVGGAVRMIKLVPTLVSNSL